MLKRKTTAFEGRIGVRLSRGDSVNGLDLPFWSAKLAKGFRIERGFDKQTKTFAWVKSLRGKAKKTNKETNIISRRHDVLVVVFLSSLRWLNGEGCGEGGGCLREGREDHFEFKFEFMGRLC
jgi:hypothetical protein